MFCDLRTLTAKQRCDTPIPVRSQRSAHCAMHTDWGHEISDLMLGIARRFSSKSLKNKSKERRYNYFLNAYIFQVKLERVDSNRRVYCITARRSFYAIEWNTTQVEHGSFNDRSQDYRHQLPVRSWVCFFPIPCSFCMWHFCLILFTVHSLP